MKKGVLFIVLFIVLLISLPQIYSDEESDLIADAYWCLADKSDGCKIGLDDQIFTYFAIDECGDKFIGESCWPSSNCDMVTTAQAIIVLEEKGDDADDALEWLMAQTSIPSGLTWLLQIDTAGTADCDITWDGGSAKVKINSDKTLTLENGGSCFSLYSGKYWLEIKDGCEPKTFNIKCGGGESFVTNLLYTDDANSNSPIFVSDETHQSAGVVGTKEKINAVCFGDGNDCDYEAGLWAALALVWGGYDRDDIAPYVPYLIAKESEYENDFMPAAFLDYITTDSEYKTKVHEAQKTPQGYWESDYGRLFTTALVLSIVGVDTSDRAKARDWLIKQLKSSSNGGCWEGDLKNTAFILATLWPNVPFECDPETEIDDCPSEHICEKRMCEEGCRNDTYCDSGRICESGECIDGCRTNDDCSGNLICDTSTHECVEPPECTVATERTDCPLESICGLDETCVEGCRSHTDCDRASERVCGSDKKCRDGCLIDSECSLGYICSANYTCIKGCKSSANCPEGKVCNVAIKECVDCLTDPDCTDRRKKCVFNDCIPKDWECGDDDHCIGGFCENHVCVECIYDYDCGSGLFCSRDPDFKCVRCLTNDHCPTGYECSTNYTCVELPECIRNIDCNQSLGETCENGHCVADTEECIYDFECRALYGDTYMCDNETNTCVLIAECDPITNPCERDGFMCENGSCVPEEGCECDINSDCDDYTGDYECDGCDCVPVEEDLDCEDENYYCMSGVDCEGNILDSYDCPGFLKCCSIGEQIETCSEAQGEKCDYGDICAGGIRITTVSDLSSGQFCCVGGNCESAPDASECELVGGVCRSTCQSDEYDSYEECDDASDNCCLPDTGGCTTDSDCTTGRICNDQGRCVVEPSSGGSLLWIWILLALIILVVIGIIFREKIKMLFMGGKRQRPLRPGLPPPSGSPMMMRRPMPRRVLPPSRSGPGRPPLKPESKKPEKPKSEFDDVMKKLKDIGK